MNAPAFLVGALLLLPSVAAADWAPVDWKVPLSMSFGGETAAIWWTPSGHLLVLGSFSIARLDPLNRTLDGFWTIGDPAHPDDPRALRLGMAWAHDTSDRYVFLQACAASDTSPDVYGCQRNRGSAAVVLVDLQEGVLHFVDQQDSLLEWRIDEARDYAVVALTSGNPAGVANEIVPTRVLGIRPSIGKVLWDVPVPPFDQTFSIGWGDQPNLILTRNDVAVIHKSWSHEVRTVTPKGLLEKSDLSWTSWWLTYDPVWDRFFSAEAREYSSVVKGYDTQFREVWKSEDRPDLWLTKPTVVDAGSKLVYAGNPSDRSRATMQVLDLPPFLEVEGAFPFSPRAEWHEYPLAGRAPIVASPIAPGMFVINDNRTPSNSADDHMVWWDASTGTVLAHFPYTVSDYPIGYRMAADPTHGLLAAQSGRTVAFFHGRPPAGTRSAGEGPWGSRCHAYEETGTFALPIPDGTNGLVLRTTHEFTSSNRHIWDITTARLVRHDVTVPRTLSAPSPGYVVEDVYVQSFLPNGTVAQLDCNLQWAQDDAARSREASLSWPVAAAAFLLAFLAFRKRRAQAG